MIDLLQNPLFLFMMVILPFFLTQMWLHQRNASVVRRLIWGIAIIVANLFGFIAFYIIEMVPDRKKTVQEAEANKKTNTNKKKGSRR